MLVSLTRIIKYGIQNFLRNWWLSISTIIILTLALIVFEGLILFNFLGQQTIKIIQNKVDISVYFKSNVTEDSILNIKRSLEGLEEVQFVEYVSREKALEEFKIKHAQDETIIQTIEELKENPLLASLNIKAKELNQYSAIASYLEVPSLKDVTDKVTYVQNQVVIEQLSVFVKVLNRLILVLTVFLTFLSIIVTFNTIRLAIFIASEQISIMRFVGASNMFIRGPFVIEGIIYGIIAALVSFLIFIPVIYFASPYFSKFVGEVDLFEYFRADWFKIFGEQLIFGLSLSIISSTIAIRRFLRV